MASKTDVVAHELTIRAHKTFELIINCEVNLQKLSKKKNRFQRNSTTNLAKVVFIIVTITDEQILKMLKQHRN